MAAQEQIEQIIELMHETHPAHFFRHTDTSQAGIGAVLRLLSQSREPVTAGRIAELMNVSTARVAVLLKKMEAKGLIIRERAPQDARVTIVRLSKPGAWKAAQLQDRLYRKVSDVIDKVGMERMLEFVTIAKEIRDIFPDPFEDGADDHEKTGCASPKSMESEGNHDGISETL